MEDKKIVVAGLICLDLTPQFTDGKVTDFYEMLQPGKVVNAKGITISGGGTVSNTGLSLARLGGNVHLMTKLGNDFFGELLEKELNAYPVMIQVIQSCLQFRDMTGYLFMMWGAMLSFRGKSWIIIRSGKRAFSILVIHRA